MSIPTLKRGSSAMNSVIDVFKIKPYDLEPVYISWLDAPRFTGNPKKDLPVEDWLKQIKEGCKQREVPKEYWHKVAQYYMGNKAKARLEELKNVMVKLHGGKYRWNWQKFKIAMRNMGWNIDPSATETVKVHAKNSGFWWISRKTSQDPYDEDSSSTIASRPSLVRSGTSACSSDSSSSSAFKSMWLSRKAATMDNADVSSICSSDTLVSTDSGRPRSERSKSSFWLPRRGSSDATLVEEPELIEAEPEPVKRPNPQKFQSDPVVKSVSKQEKEVPGVAPLPVTSDDTVDAKVPTWLLNASNALSFLQNEHPKVMTTLSAVLITVGSLPALPAMHAGAGGALLASGAAQALGAIAVGMGQLIKSSQDPGSGSGHASEAH